MPDSNRLVEVKGGTEGSGYLIARRLILTSWHVMGSQRAAQVRIYRDYRAATGAEKLQTQTARVLWPSSDPGDDNDFALLLTEQETSQDDDPIDWIELPRDGHLDVEGTGFPDSAIFRNRFLGLFGRTPSPERDTRSIKGRVAVGSILKQREVYRSGAIDVVLPVEDLPSGPKESWRGMSGAALFTNDKLVAIIKDVQDIRGFHRLRALPVDRLFIREDVREALRSAGLNSLPASNAASRPRSFNPLASLHLLDRRVIGQRILDRIETWNAPVQEPLLLALRVGQDDEVHRLAQRLCDVEFEWSGINVLKKTIEWPSDVSGDAAISRLLRDLKDALAAGPKWRRAPLAPAEVRLLVPDPDTVLLVHSVIDTRAFEQEPGQAALLEWWRQFWCDAAAAGIRAMLLIAFEDKLRPRECCENPMSNVCMGATSPREAALPDGLHASWHQPGALPPIEIDDLPRWLELITKQNRDWRYDVEQIGLSLDVTLDRPNVLPRRLRCMKLALPVLLGQQHDR